MLDGFSFKSVPDVRTAERYIVWWRMALVFEDQEHMPAYHGRTRDLSYVGTGMLTHVNLMTRHPVIILLAPPPLSTRERRKIIEIRSKQIIAVYSGESRCFRLSFAFLEFKNDGLDYLRARLKNKYTRMDATKLIT